MYKLIFLVFFLIILYTILKKKEKFKIINDILVVDFKGGIGNQLFFLATAFEYSKKFNKKLIIKDKKGISSYGGPRDFKKKIYKNFNIKNINIDKFKKLDEQNINKYYPGNILLSTKNYYQNYKYFINTKKEFTHKIILCSDNKKKELCGKYNLNSKNKNICIHLRYSDKFTPKNWDGIYSDKEIEKIINHCYENYKNENILIFSNNNEKNLKKFNNFKNLIILKI